MKKNWVFTEQTEPRLFYENLEELYNSKKSHVGYICGQLEIGGNTDKLHFQGYIQLKRTQRLSWLKKNISSTAHFEPQKAKINDEAREYCMKDDTQEEEPLEYGKYVRGRGGTRERSDLTKYKKAIQEGQTKREILETHTNEFARYTRFYDTVRSLTRPTRTEEFEVHLYYGEPGTGKTRKVYEDYPDHYEIPVSDKIWYDGYDLHKVVLMDDFAGKASKLPLTDLLKVLDRYPRQVAIKGSFTWYMPDLVIITTNIHPRMWYDWTTREVHWRALKRRITKIYQFFEDTEPEEQISDYFLENYNGLEYEQSI